MKSGQSLAISAASNIDIGISEGTALLVQVTGNCSFDGTVDFQASMDGANFTNTPYINANSATPALSVAQLSSPSTLTEYLIMPPLTQVRIAVGAPCTGDVDIKWREVDYHGPFETSASTYLAVPSADSTANATTMDVVGNKTDAAVSAVGTDKSVVGYLKGILTELLTGPGETQFATTTYDLGDCAGAGTFDLFTGTTANVQLESLVFQMPNVDASDDCALTSISIQTDDTEAGVIIDSTTGAVANLTAEAQLAWTGALVINTGTKIQLTIAGGAADATTTVTFIAKYRSITAGGTLA